jgi:putative transcriptional regulator
MECKIEIIPSIKEIRSLSGLSQEKFSKEYGIPLGTLRHWEAGERQPPEYVLRLLEKAVKYDMQNK